MIVAADPEGSILSEPESLNETDVQFYEVEGIGYDFLPTVLDRSVVDRWIKTNDQKSFPLARRLISEEGILSGGSSGTAMSVALTAAKALKKGQKCVVILPDGIRNYMSKFVSDNWMEARNLKPIVNEHNHWWWNEKVASLELAKPFVIQANTTCKDALELMKTNHLEQVNIVGDGGALKGVLTLAHLTKKVVSMNLQLSSPVETAIFKQFRKVNSDTLLGLVSRILEVDAFAIVGETNEVITRMDLLGFLAKGKTATNGSNGTTNGATNGSSGTINGATNGHK